MASNGNIIKIANGNLQETAKQEYTSFAKTMQSNAAQKVNEQSKNGVQFGKPQKMKYVTPDGLNIRAAVFFDGTMNNRTNANQKPGNGNGSYGNDKSNVARLFENFKQDPAVIKLYIEGIGTLDNEDDATKVGGGFGAGPTGIPMKVRKGCQLLAEKILSKAAGKTINTITLDVFGFSRGAAAARNFVHEVKQESYPSKQRGFLKFDVHGEKTNLKVLPKGGELGRILSEKKIKYNTISICFAGLFDTVSSFNKSGFSLSPDFDNDVTELHLNEMYKAEKVIHFTAADEHRVYFSLTRIQSAKEKGIEKEFPGVHSDIGGSYPTQKEVVDEIVNGLPDALEKERLRVVDQGWYTDEELTVNNWTGKLSGTRDLKKDYSFIPLHFMSEFATKMPVPLLFDQVTLEKKFPISKNPAHLLCYIKTRLHAYVFGKAGRLLFIPYSTLKAALRGKKITAAQYATLLEEQKQLRLLRNKFLHWSADYDGVAETMKPNIEKGIRKRIPHEG